MLEILKLLVDLVTGGAKLKEMKRAAEERERLSDLGYELYKLYSDLNLVFTTGKKLTTCLEKDVERLKDETHYWKDRVLSCDTVYSIKQQTFCVRSAMQSVRRLEPILIITSPDVVKKLFPLVAVKWALLYRTSVNPVKGNLVELASVDPDALQRSLAATQAGTIEYVPEYEHEALDVEYENWEEVNELYQHLNELEIPITSDEPQQYVTALQKFLAKAKFREQLAEVEKGLESFRNDLLANFDKKDLLLRVGDENQLFTGPF